MFNKKTSAMKHLFTPIPALLITLTTLTSCIMTTTVQEIEETVTTRQEPYNSKASYLKEGLLAIQIQNNAENTILQIDSMEICNIQLMDPAGELMHNGSPACTGSIMFINNTLQFHYGADTTYCQGTSTEIKIPAQTLTPWNPALLPTGSKNTYAKIHGTMYTHIADNTLFPIYTGTMYYPLCGTIPAATTGIPAKSLTPITITLHPNCPLYAIINSQLEKVLQPITFTVTVEDWE